jgi:predicted transcriptional regulator of viral defense system
LNSYTRPKRDPKIYSQILNAAEEKIKEKGYFKIRDIMVSTGLCYNSVKKRIVRLKKLNKIVIIEQGKYTIEKNVRGSTFW